MTQSNTAAAREQLFAMLRRRLNNKVTTVVDSTNLRGDQRAELLAAARADAVPAVAILLDVSVERCHQRIAERARIIRDEVLAQHTALRKRTLHDVGVEEYTTVHVLPEARIPTVRFRHAWPTDPDPDRWVDVEQLGPAGRIIRFPADELRRHPAILATLRPTPLTYARVAADHALTLLDAHSSGDPQSPGDVEVRVRLPHCLPLRLTRDQRGWHTATATRSFSGQSRVVGRTDADEDGQNAECSKESS
jgi:predicted kinase